jgi:hypothetical protein
MKHINIAFDEILLAFGIDKDEILDPKNSKLRREYFPVICAYLKSNYSFTHRLISEFLKVRKGSSEVFCKAWENTLKKVEKITKKIEILKELKKNQEVDNSHTYDFKY